jgi:hypothetical protein
MEKTKTSLTTKWKIAHSGYANTPFVIFQGDKRPDFMSAHPLQGVDVIAEIPFDEGLGHENQKRYAKMIAATMDMYTALRRIRSQVEGGFDTMSLTEIHEMADTAITQAEGR